MKTPFGLASVTIAVQLCFDSPQSLPDKGTIAEALKTTKSFYAAQHVLIDYTTNYADVQLHFVSRERYLDAFMLPSLLKETNWFDIAQGAYINRHSETTNITMALDGFRMSMKERLEHFKGISDKNRAFVFTPIEDYHDASYTPITIAHCASHELGHVFGLTHVTGSTNLFSPNLMEQYTDLIKTLRSFNLTDDQWRTVSNNVWSRRVSQQPSSNTTYVLDSPRTNACTHR